MKEEAGCKCLLVLYEKIQTYSFREFLGKVAATSWFQTAPEQDTDKPEQEQPRGQVTSKSSRNK